MCAWMDACMHAWMSARLRKITLNGCVISFRVVIHGAPVWHLLFFVDKLLLFSQTEIFDDGLLFVPNFLFGDAEAEAVNQHFLLRVGWSRVSPRLDVEGADLLGGQTSFTRGAMETECLDVRHVRDGDEHGEAPNTKSRFSNFGRRKIWILKRKSRFRGFRRRWIWILGSRNEIREE